MNRVVYLLLVVAITLNSCAGNEEKDSEWVIDESAIVRIDSTLQSFVDSGYVAGTSVLIFEKGDEVYFNAAGYADREAEIPMARNSIIQIYSMTKPITGVALMTLYEEGAFQLDDPVSKYAPEFLDLKVYEGDDANGNPILIESKRALTIRDLTRHTSGFANDTNQPYVGRLLEEAAPLHHENSLADFAEKLGSLPLVFHPGEQWYYGPSVDVQAYLVEKLSGQSFDEYVKEHILDPLGMNETRYYVPQEDRDRMVSSYAGDNDGNLNRIPDDEAHAFNINKVTLTPGGWGLTSTLDDYMAFTQMLVNKGELDGIQILKPETVELMATNHLSDDVTERLWLPTKGQVGFGIDFAVRLRPPATPDENKGEVGEFFWDGAASTLFWVDPVNDLTAVFFVQKFPFDGRLHRDFRDAVYHDQ
ncbi:MAG: serine hydrolase domain-containing protein [Gracilimonas sp.]